MKIGSLLIKIFLSIVAKNQRYIVAWATSKILECLSQMVKKTESEVDDIVVRYAQENMLESIEKTLKKVKSQEKLYEIVSKINREGGIAGELNMDYDFVTKQVTINFKGIQRSFTLNTKRM